MTSFVTSLISRFNNIIYFIPYLFRDNQFAFIFITFFAFVIIKFLLSLIFRKEV